MTDKPVTHFASEKVLSNDWLSSKEDKAWHDLQQVIVEADKICEERKLTNDDMDNWLGRNFINN